MLRRLAIICVATVALSSQSQADQQLQLELRPSPHLTDVTILDIRNVGAEPVTILGGQLNGRCDVVPYSDKGNRRLWVSQRVPEADLFEGDVLGPFPLNVGEAFYVSTHLSPCATGNSKVVRIRIDTVDGEHSFSVP